MTRKAEARKGWRTVRFDAMAENITDRVENPRQAGVERYVGLEHLEPESLKIRRWGTPDDVEATKLRFKPGDIIFGKRRFYQRKLAVADFEGICSAHALVLRARTENVVPEFLPFFMQSEEFFQRAMSISVGSLSPTINWSALARQEFALPPKEEQRRIAEMLLAANNSAERLKRVYQAIHEVYLAVVDDIFSKRKSRKAKHDSQLVTLGKVCIVQSGFPFESKSFSTSGDRLLRCSNVGIDRCIWEVEDTKYWPAERREEVSEHVLYEDDIVIAMDRPFIGDGFKVARLSQSDLPALLLQRVGRFQTTSLICKDYLWHFLHSSSFQYHLRKEQQGTDLPHVSRFDIESALVPLPSIKGQQEVLAKFRRVEKALQNAKNAMESASQLTNSLRTKFLRS